MAVSFEHPKSIADFMSQCWVPIVYLKSRFFYAYGNTPMEDLLEDLQVSEKTDILLLGAGDIRHLLKTVAGLHLRPQSAGQPKTLNFHLDDIDTEVIARDIVLLELIDSIDPDKLSDIEYIWDVWYNMTLSESHHDRLKVTLERLVGGASSSKWCFGDKDTKRQVQAAWKYWLESQPWDVQKVRESRKKFVDYYVNFYTKSKSNSESCVLPVPGTPFHKDSEFYANYETTDYLKEWNSVYEFGCARDFESDLGEENEKYINPTMMRPGSEQWHVHYGINPLSAYLPLERSFLEKYSTLVKACIASLQLVIKQFVSMCTKIKLVVTFWSTDAFALCHLKLSPDTKFDLIHTSNLPDHIGLLNLLVTCEPRLKGPCSILVTETFRWAREWQQLADHIEANTCCPPLLLPTALGLRLGEDFDLGSSKRPSWMSSLSSGQIMPETIRWVKCLDVQSVPISLSDSPDITKLLTRVVDLCFPPDVNSLLNYGDGRSAVSPLALPCILQRLQHLISGGISALVSFVDEILKSRSQQRLSYTMTWDVLCQAYRLCTCSDEILIIQMHFPYQFPKVDEPNAVGFSPPTCLAMPNFGEMDLLMAMASVFTDNMVQCMEIFRVYFFNANDESFTIPILQNTWNSIPQYHQWMLWMAETMNNLTNMPYCKRGDASIAAKFDSLESSGTLPSLVVANQGTNCSEFEDRYELQTTVDNRGLKIKLETVFLPCDSLIRTAVRLIANSAGQGKFSFDVTWNFSCCLVPSKCKFQISSKTGCIQATLAKETEYYNLGQSALPLRRIDDCELTPFSSPADIQSYFQKSNLNKAVFMSPRDMELIQNSVKCGNTKITNPFFCLRQTIVDMWEKSYEAPTMKTLSYYLPEHKNLDIPFLSKIDIQVRGHFLYRGLPLVKITFIDTQKAKSLIMEGDIPEHIVLRKRQELIPHEELYGLAENQSMGSAIIYEQEFRLTRRLLITNSLRIRQDRRKLTDNDWYWDTYLELLFDRTRSTTIDFNKLMNDPSLTMPSSLPITEPVKPTTTDKSATSVENVVTKCAHCNQSSSSLKRCGRCHMVSYCGQQCQIADWSKHKVTCGPHTSADLKAEVSPREEIAKLSCFLCHKTEVKLKRCTRCQSVSYCSKECQTLDWKSHKLTCR